VVTIFELRTQQEPTETEYLTVKALWDDHYAVSGIMQKTGLSYAVVRAAIRRAKEEASAASRS
jgi:hypothetical protein